MNLDTGQGVTFAQFVGNGQSGIIGVLNTIVIPTIFALAFAVFLFGILKYFFLDAASEDGRKKGRQFAIWGIIGMVIMLSMWGLVAILLSTLGFS